MSERADADRLRGFYRKFDVRRTDGSSEPGGKHENCVYFVLDLNHDPYAAHALVAYAVACRAEYPELARDIEQMLRDEQRELLQERIAEEEGRRTRKRKGGRS